jgi:hypothetical protein
MGAPISQEQAVDGLAELISAIKLGDHDRRERSQAMLQDANPEDILQGLAIIGRWISSTDPDEPPELLKRCIRRLEGGATFAQAEAWPSSEPPCLPTAASSMWLL